LLRFYRRRTWKSGRWRRRVDAIAGVTGKVGENLIAAASDAGQRLTQGIAERASEGLKELVYEVGEKFTDKLAGKTQDPGAMPSNVSGLPNGT
jgi:hypothetical protein